MVHQQQPASQRRGGGEDEEQQRRKNEPPEEKKWSGMERTYRWSTHNVDAAARQAKATTADHLLVAAAAVAHLGPRLSSGGVEWYKEGQQATERMERI